MLFSNNFKNKVVKFLTFQSDLKIKNTNTDKLKIYETIWKLIILLFSITLAYLLIHWLLIKYLFTQFMLILMDHA